MVSGAVDYNALKFYGLQPRAGAILRIVTTVMMAASSKEIRRGIRRLSSTETAIAETGVYVSSPGGWPDCDLESPALECNPNPGTPWTVRDHWCIAGFRPGHP